MIPYLPAPPALHVGFLTISVFNVLLTAGVLLGIFISARRAERFGMDRDAVPAACGWTIVFGLIGGHLAKMLMDYHSLVASNPWLLLTSGRGLRSLGVLYGGLIGFLLFCCVKRVAFRDFFRGLDIAVYALPFAFLIGRLGCALVHDHRGLPSTSWIAVRFPEGPRYDLGLIEFLFLIPMSAAFLWLDRRPHRPGFFLGLYAIVYGTFRVWLDTLHIQPMRFYGGTAGCVIGVIAWVVMTRLYPACPHPSLNEDSQLRAGNRDAD